MPYTRWLRAKGRGFSGTSSTPRPSPAYSGRPARLRRAWAVFDVIVSPTLARLPALVGELRDDDDPAADFAAQVEYTPWTSVWNLTGWPAISLPLHRVEVDGATLPVGVMLGGRHGSEETLLSLSVQLEQARPWRDAFRKVADVPRP